MAGGFGDVVILKVGGRLYITRGVFGFELRFRVCFCVVVCSFVI